MAHLRLVHPSDPDPPPSPWHEQTLDLPGLTSVLRDVADEPDEEDIAELDLPDPAFMTLLEAVDELFVGRSPQDKVLIGEGFYFDATGAPRTRHNQLRVVS